MTNTLFSLIMPGMRSACIFPDGSIDIVFIQTHLYLHGSGIAGEFLFSEMVEEKQNPYAQSDRVGKLQYGKAAGDVTGNLCIDLAE